MAETILTLNIVGQSIDKRCDLRVLPMSRKTDCIRNHKKNAENCEKRVKGWKTAEQSHLNSISGSATDLKKQRKGGREAPKKRRCKDLT